jgi:type IV secretion system protein VirB11
MDEEIQIGNAEDGTNLALRLYTKKITEILQDESINEIMINGSDSIFIERNGVTESYTDEGNFFTLDKLDHIASLIANKAKQEVNIRNPLLASELVDGERIQIVLPPCCEQGKIIFSIRKPHGKSLSLDDYQNAGSFDNVLISGEENSNPLEAEFVKAYKEKDMMSFFKLAVKLKKNIVVAGETGSGKTTFTNALLQAVSINDRVITIEDVREINLNIPNKVHLLVSDGNQGTSNIGTDRLIKTCLRLNPDRIIVSEIRGEEITAFLGAIESGHNGCITSLHAGSCDDAWRRMVKMLRMSPMNSHSSDDFLMESLKHSIDVIVYFKKDADGIRRPKEVFYDC